MCETSPSYECLGFVSLKTGAEGCAAATSATGLVKAHQNLENAVYIFRSQESDKAYLQLAIAEHLRNRLIPDRPVCFADYFRRHSQGGVGDTLCQSPLDAC